MSPGSWGDIFTQPLGGDRIMELRHWTFMCYPVPPIRCRIELRPAIPMRRTLKAALALTLLCAPLLSAPAPRQEVHAGAAVPIVVELFTSEGCSDCPRADALLAQLDRLQPVAGALIIPLEE